MIDRFLLELRAIGVVAAAVLVTGCGSDSEPAARAPADGVAIEVRADPDAPESGDDASIPGLWIIALPREARPSHDQRADVAALRAAGAEVVRTDARGRATLRRLKGTLLLSDLGSSDAPSPVAALRTALELPVNTGQTYRLTFGEAGLTFSP